MDDADAMVSDCEARESKLTYWERDFIDGLRNRLDDGRGITDRQMDVLDKIWERVT